MNYNQFNSGETEKKAPPTVEKSLNNISWHLKTLSENLLGIKEMLEKRMQERNKN
jgi:hypothetical protein